MSIKQAFFNDYSAMEATWVAGKLSFEILRLSFVKFRLGFETFSSSFWITLQPCQKIADLNENLAQFN